MYAVRSATVKRSWARVRLTYLSECLNQPGGDDNDDDDDDDESCSLIASTLSGASHVGASHMGELHPRGTPILEPNLYPWSGDHCSTDPDLVPGILLVSVALPQAPAGRRYHVRDIAATVLEHFGIDHADLDGEATALPFAPTPR